jgi:formylglycine-generating enzyme required for sulfatase activity
MTSLILNRQKGQNQYYEEALANEVLPLQMMLIPAGSFLMGSPPDDSNSKFQPTDIMWSCAFSVAYLSHLL